QVQQQQHQQPNPRHAAPPPPHPEPANPVQPPLAPAKNPVVNAPAIDRIPAPAGPVALQPVVQVAQQHTAESAALRARLAQLEADRNEVPPHAGAAPPVLFVDQFAIDKAREAAIAARDGNKKPSLPNIIPGFKANSLNVSIKVDDAFKNFCYVPYSLLTLASHIKAARGEEDIVFNAQGGLTVKALDRRDEKSISAVDWHTAARATEERIRFHHAVHITGKLRWNMTSSNVKWQLSILLTI
ncbi:hypothetical protein PILCRDRAFT_8308, partial [Piloderma croceum F 1598]